MARGRKTLLAGRYDEVVSPLPWAGGEFMTKFRIDRYTFGEIKVPAEHLWGAQTQRSLHHYHISAERMPEALTHALALTKLAATKVNHDLGLIDSNKAGVIIQVVDEVLDGCHVDEFLLSVW